MGISFDSIGNGELAGMFRLALSQIGQNIMDPNSDPEAARGMTINIKFKPSKAGTIGADYDIKTKLAGLRKSETTFLIGQDARTGRIEISEYGNNRASIQALDAVQPTPGRDFNPDTGEIHDRNKGPIDLRNAAQS